jgi:hypothetical protein
MFQALLSHTNRVHDTHANTPTPVGTVGGSGHIIPKSIFLHRVSHFFGVRSTGSGGHVTRNRWSGGGAGAPDGGEREDVSRAQATRPAEAVGRARHGSGSNSHNRSGR